ncbi:DUF4335 domain-containing protein [Anabaena sp. FACHB-709]|uniref:DUF4335 domain-containing protein n=2 Tax=Nostocaceae TaxID=1162 RepID=A0A1Z4KPZ0_ANAVA|nr:MULTISPECIES: DUF4335 domain-containing protein [Nostocaceae]BAY71017.1 hypothetical protein NIES23_38300 [Trichormus variabilis NIES-23]HBW29235.1 DUF4335 domain-containing protein [Nostoc sp. UBA8866]MBD2171820.1 DUF4335 domain-containing protein [Anabaena cylindrica FACHB-318]MBD2263398.1 DUF4335 domain-containing protein [Anabaena sp. FACHB-709]MBD2272942.1 DUF4335 domain-containing protein [Nostoc sp. PCC 7120 = FACHB-418]
MPLSNSVIRRYTPPTCTLEVLAQSSPLSRWMGKPVLRHLTFELRFDDPQLPEENRVPIRGDRDQLEALCDAVTTYVQQFLQQPPDSFRFNVSELEDSTKVSTEELTDFHQASLLSKTTKSFIPQIPGTKIYLEPGDYLTHNLFLGSLANQASGYVIQLSLLQLFDLATALDEYSTDVMALPSLNNTSSIVRFPAWASVAAVLVLALGLTPLTWQYANNTKQKDQQTATNSNPNDEQIALQPTLPNFPAPQSELAPANNSSTLPLGSAPPPPPNTGLPTTPLISPNTSFPGNSPTTTNSALPPNSVASKQALNIPQTNIPPISGNPGITIPGQQVAIQPNPSGGINSGGVTLKRSLPPRLSTSTSNLSSGIPPVPPPLATIPNNAIPQAYSPVTSQAARSRVNTSPELAETSSLIDGSRSEAKTALPSEIATSNTSTLFDTPQVAEAREFFKKRWQPPSGFVQTLEYSVMLGVDGSIERILPLGKAARDYVDLVGMPAIGEPFVSANRSGQMTRIRVLLSPDGKVQTFPETE